MCGVFAYVGRNGEAMDLERVARIASVTERRGSHAFGFAWIDPAGRVKAFKGEGRITQHLGLLGMARDAAMLIGHCRFATAGDPSNNLNNHPHPSDGGWIVHNGVVGNYHDLMEDHHLRAVTECDSEALSLLIERLPGGMVDRFAGAVRAAAPGGPVALLGLWPRPRRLLAARSGNPLCLGQAREGWYLGSLGQELPGEVRSLGDGDLIEFTHRKGQGYARLHKGIADGEAGVSFDADAEEGLACGGGLSWRD